MCNCLHALNKTIETNRTLNQEHQQIFKEKSKAFLEDIGHKLGFSEIKVYFTPAVNGTLGKASLYGMWSENSGLVVHLLSEYDGDGDNILYRELLDVKDFYPRPRRNRWTSTSIGEVALLEKFFSMRKT